ncbi:MAG: 1-acyl-sn-glycerol-3-phosphate acyltransferase [Alistipes sp.]|nr:1-acyl-sn-glycerol-3-phosphate acyltransferase [Alistipes sp.]
MVTLFLTLYAWFKRHRAAFWLTLAGSVAVVVWFALQVRFEENISSFFDDGSGRGEQEVFDNLKLKDRIVVMLTGDDPDTILDAGYTLSERLTTLIDEGLLTAVTSAADETTIGATSDFVYRYLPLWLEEADYQRLDSLLRREGMRSSLEATFRLLSSPTGLAVGEVVRRDPLAIGTHLMRRFERFNTHTNYELYGGALFTEDMRSMLFFLSPAFGMGSTGSNERLVGELEQYAATVEEEYAVQVDYVGGPIVAVHNARCIKQDTSITLTLALLVIVAVLFFSFSNRRAIPLIITPPLFGALFSLAIIYFVQGEISAIAIGAGAVVMGIALSYSIHVVAHSNHTAEPIQIIRELAYPLTIGCLTTIGAFVALLFTRSVMLHDLGLFSALALVGTTLFCLIFLPHFIRPKRQARTGRLMAWIECANDYDYARNRWAVGVLAVLTIVALFLYRGAGFDSNMANLNYVPEDILRAEERLEEAFGDQSRQVYLVSSADDPASTATAYARLDSLATALQGEGLIENYTSVGDFVLPREEQELRIARWNRFWEGRRERVLADFEQASLAAGFRAGAFPAFEELVTKHYEPCGYSAEELQQVPILSDWINNTERGALLVSRMELETAAKEEVYGRLAQLETTQIIDRAYFSSRMVEQASEDFDFILLISSLIVFVALWISYGRIELAVMAFLPMCITWVIILGLMALFDIRFNIVNVILATFIFGIGDDFSIFIMDGLLEEYRTGRKLLGAHKTAIFFSAFTTVVGMGVLIFARHPALQSIALISVLGMVVVLLVAYTLQPFLFRLLVTSQTARQGSPYTLMSLLGSVFAFTTFFVGCLYLQAMILVLELLPLKRACRKAIFHRSLYRFTRFFLWLMPMVKTVRENPAEERFERPAVLIANHQSFIDILLLLSTTPRLVLVTNSWVWHSPFFGRIVRYADCYHAADGYEQLAERLRPRVEEGYTVALFPEGTRSVDGTIGRFHKGAFYLAEQLQLDILPLVIYGAGMVSPKRTGFHIRRGWLVTRTLARVKADDTTFGENYREQAKAYRKLFCAEYEALQAKYGVTENPWFRQTVLGNYIYKSPVQEWYMRVKLPLDGYYRLWNRLIPRRARVTDVGCGLGQMATMLSLLGPERTLVGLDYDEEKILQASHSHLSSERLQFRLFDMRYDSLPESDVFLFNDSLHYIAAESQRAVLHRAVEALSDGGMILVRDGDASRDEKRHEAILRTERWSTRILRFNRTDEALHFVDREFMMHFAEEEGLSLRIEACDRTTSETMYILTKSEKHGRV